MFKLIILPRTRTGLGRAGLRRHLEQVHGPLVMAHPEASGMFRSYVHHYTLDDGVAPFGRPVLADRDAITIIRFDSPQDIAVSKGSAAYRQVIAPDEDNFRDLAGSVALHGTETVLLPDNPAAERKLFICSAEASTGRTARLAALLQVAGIGGINSNAVRVLDGDFPYAMIDEIGMLPGADHGAVARALTAAGLLDGADLLMTEPVTFLAL